MTTSIIPFELRTYEDYQSLTSEKIIVVPSEYADNANGAGSPYRYIDYTYRTWARRGRPDNDYWYELAVDGYWTYAHDLCRRISWTYEGRHDKDHLELEHVANALHIEGCLCNHYNPNDTYYTTDSFGQRRCLARIQNGKQCPRSTKYITQSHRCKVHQNVVQDDEDKYGRHLLSEWVKNKRRL